MKDLLEKLRDQDNSIKIHSPQAEKPFEQLVTDIDRLEKLIYFLAEELSK